MKNETGLQIQTTKRLLPSRSEKGLLKIITQCVNTNTALTFEQLVDCYSDTVNEEIYYDHYEYKSGKQFIIQYHNVIDCYKANNYVWRQKIKGLVKSWFIGAIGRLVIKGYLRILPVIEID